jgi:pimeloyl-ACP methyl ester carboxylesterase
MFLKSEDADILVSEFGAGPRTLVAHGGWVGSGELWHPPFRDLSRDWRCITYDHRGTGATRARAPAITFDLLVDDLFRVLDALSVERCVLAGESMARWSYWKRHCGSRTGLRGWQSSAAAPAAS